jgi:hypothetical protein
MSRVELELRKRLSGRRGQNTVEYLMMLLVVVAVAGMTAVALKKFMPGLFSQIESAITGAAGSISQPSGN